jgi:hypothetical protein
MHPTDPAGIEIHVPAEQARARALPTAALVAVLAERGEPGDIPGDQLGELLSLAEQEQAHPGGREAINAAIKMHGRIGLMPRLAREVVILRALAAHKLPCGHGLGDIVYGGPDLNGLPAVAQCGQCLADRQKAKAALPRTPHAVLVAMRQAYTAARFAAHVAALRAPLGTAEETAAFERLKRLETWRLVVENEAASEAALGEDYGTDWTDDVLAADYEARLAGTRPLDAPPPEAP